MTRPFNTAAHTPAAGVLKKLLCASLIGALGAIAAPANAAVITFDGVQNVVTPLLNAGTSAYETGDAFTQAGFTFQVNNSAAAEPDEGRGLVGALINSDNPFACTVTACPVGGDGLYFAGLNDGTMNITSQLGIGFRVDGLRYAFIAPLVGLPDGIYGQLVLSGVTRAGTTINVSSGFPTQDNAGNFTFDQFLVDSAFRNTTLTSLTINTCLYDADVTGCYSAPRDFTQNQAQFALDDLNLTVIPEPSSYALMLLGMAGLTLVSRRRAR